MPTAGDGEQSATVICGRYPFLEPTDLDCTEAVTTAFDAMGATPSDFRRAWVEWNIRCPDGPCGRPEPDVVQVVAQRADGSGVGVIVHRLATGDLRADEPVELNPDVFRSSPPVMPTNRGIYTLAGAPADVAARTPASLCGTENARLAGPFNPDGRDCFVSQVLSGRDAEFLSRRQGMEGEPFTELWRYPGRGPVIVYAITQGRWTTLRCALILVGGAQRFDHTGCVAETPS